MSEDANPSEDVYLAHLKDARNRPAVIKLRLVQLRSSYPTGPIFAFEGDDDKLVFYQWIKRIRPTLCYEPLPCRGKTGVLTLRTTVLRDVNGLGESVYFFVDRDFDDLRGEDPLPNTFMTDKYSVENYLVSEEVLEDLLKNELHCHGRHDIRADIVAAFLESYSQFLSETKELNRRVYVARRLEIELSRPLPKKLSQIAAVTLGASVYVGKPPEEVVALKEAPTDEDWNELSAEFDQLEAAARYRGKFAMLFFIKWLEELVTEYKTRTTDLFKNLELHSKARSGEFTLNNFASKAEIPFGLGPFIEAVT